jgi:shikimate 5-dehydrogenase
MGIAPARLEGMDLPLDVAPDRVRAAIRQIADDRAVRGALVTTHKIAVHRHARDLFSGLDRNADWLGEVSAIVKSPGGLVGRAMDMVTSGLALDRIVPRDHWRAHPESRALVLGAGGAGLALAAHMLGRQPDERPCVVTLCDVDGEKTAHAASVLNAITGGGASECRQVRGAAENDRLMAALPPHSLVVNATGLGKDRPGSPISGTVRFPLYGIAWEFNYRGSRDFLVQARAQRGECELTVADGWTYFLYGWAHVIAEVFGIALDDCLFARLEKAARTECPTREDR